MFPPRNEDSFASDSSEESTVRAGEDKLKPHLSASSCTLSLREVRKQYSPSCNCPLYPLRWIDTRRQMRLLRLVRAERGIRGLLRGGLSKVGWAAGFMCWALDYAGIECGHGRFIRWYFERAARQAARNINLAAKWRVWHVLSVQRAQRDTAACPCLSAIWSGSQMLLQLDSQSSYRVI